MTSQPPPRLPRVAFITSDEEEADDDDVTNTSHVMTSSSPYSQLPPKPPKHQARPKSRDSADVTPTAPISDDVTVDDETPVKRNRRKKRRKRKKPTIEPLEGTGGGEEFPTLSSTRARPSSAAAPPGDGNEELGRKRIVSAVATSSDRKVDDLLQEHPNQPEVGDEEEKSETVERTEAKRKGRKQRKETASGPLSSTGGKKKQGEKTGLIDSAEPIASDHGSLATAAAAAVAPSGGNPQGDYPATYAPPHRDAIPAEAVRSTALSTSANTVVGALVPGMTQQSSGEKPGIYTPAGDNHTRNKDGDAAANAGFEMDDEGGAAVMTSLTTGDRRLKSTLHFHDGKRKIDFVMAYIETDDEDDDVNDRRRKVYEKALMRKGLELEIEPKEESQDQVTCFVKIHVPYDVLLAYAERMRMKMPLKEDRVDFEEGDDQHECCDSIDCKMCCTQPFRLENPELDDRDQDNYTAEFTRDKIEFFDVKNEDTFFSDSQRSRIAYRIMNETKFGDEKTMVGINRLINDGTYDCVYPLHDGAYDVDKFEIANQQNMRGLLYREWGRWGRWYKYQPLDAIRKYFGDKIALYFAWLGFYTEMLVYPTVVGLICMIYSCVSLTTYPPVKEICDPSYPTYAGDLVMCPQCDRDCGYWNLNKSCVAAEITHIFDNNSTIFFAIFMSLWATTFLEVWKRRQFKLNYEWDLVDYDEERDLIRPEFEAKVTRERINPVTRRMEPFLSPRDRCTRVCFSAVTVFFWVIVVCAAVIAVIIYRIVISSVFAYNIDPDTLGAIGSYATPSLLTTITGSLLSLILIMILNTVYEKIAIWLTDLELPRTQIEFEDSFTFKMFCFQFVNYYSYLFYVAFLKNLLAGLPPNYNYFAGNRWEECDAGGCMYELSLQLVIIMFGKQVWNNIVEIVWPWAVTKYRQWRSAMTTQTSPDNMYTRWEQDYDLQPFQQLALFYEYLEMVIQFGFATLFVSAFPLAPALALINNIFEIRLDANKLICESRRPIAQKCSDIGVWYYLLDFLGTLAVITNAFTIAFTSQSIPKLVYYYVYSLEIYNERTMQGFTNNSLAVFDVRDFSSESRPALNPTGVDFCRYRAYRTPPSDPNKYETTKQYWHVIAAQLAFVIVMEHVVMLCKWLIDYVVPDRPKALQVKIKREHFLVHEVLVKADVTTLLKKQNMSLTSDATLESGDVISHQPEATGRTGVGGNSSLKVVKETTEL